MKYFANFQVFGGNLFRFDTRIYLDAKAQPNADDVCIGAIIAKNPGSARTSPDRYRRLAELDLGFDKMLPVVGHSFQRAFAMAGKTPGLNQYVAVWNLFYLCNKDLQRAICTYSSIAFPPYCESEESLSPPIVWYAWGKAKGKDLQFLNDLKPRFINRSYATPFFFDTATHSLQSKAPSLSDFARHPQGLKMAPIDKFIADHL